MPYFLVSHSHDCSSAAELDDFKTEIAQALDVFLHYATVTNNAWIVYADRAVDVVRAMTRVLKNEGFVVVEIADIEFRDLGEKTEAWIVDHLKDQR